MRIEQFIKQFLKEIITILLFVFTVMLYLNLPFKIIDVYELKSEILEKSLKETSLYLDEDVDFSRGYLDSFSKSLPFSQIIEYKKQKFIYDLLIYNKSSKQISGEAKDIVRSINSFNSLKEIIKLTGKNNSEYALYQILGVISVLLIIAIIYVIIKYKKPSILSYYVFILGLFYITNLVFYSSRLQKEKLIENTLKETYMNINN